MAPFDMKSLALLAATAFFAIQARAAYDAADKQVPLRDDLRAACPDYVHYSAYPHPPFSEGPLGLPFQRPAPPCRTFTSEAVEKVIRDVTARMVDKDLARIFENAFPNTLDTTVRWHVNGTENKNSKKKKKKSNKKKKPSSSSSSPAEPADPFNRPADSDSIIDDDNTDSPWQGAQSFIVTGDINAEWLRDSTNQLAQYQPLAKRDAALRTLIRGAIGTQAEFVLTAPYCNAFQPPPPSRLRAVLGGLGATDRVHPAYEPARVFECKWELDSLAHFLALSTRFWQHTRSAAFLTPRWYAALRTLLRVLQRQARPTFEDDDADDGSPAATAKKEKMTATMRHFLPPASSGGYTFRRVTDSGTETLCLAGAGNPLGAGAAGLVRSAFRPSDDATVFGFLVPANAQMAVELKRTADMLRAVAAGEGRGSDGDGNDEDSVQPPPPGLVDALHRRGEALEKAVWEHGVVRHKTFGDVFAYEVDGYGSALFMDDANVPSLLALPFLGFVDRAHPTYRNTRRMILSRAGNPYYLEGRAFKGIGGPHIGLEYAWPMSLLMQAMTSDDDAEITECLQLVRNASRLGLVHESVHVDSLAHYTRSWFAWANSVFAQTILDLAQRKPHLLFGAEHAEPYIIS